MKRNQRRKRNQNKVTSKLEVSAEELWLTKKRKLAEKVLHKKMKNRITKTLWVNLST
jgi:hypothetical protein